MNIIDRFTKFYAWVGFLAILSGIAYAIYYVVTGLQFLSAHGF